jgi:hypothetical protein
MDVSAAILQRVSSRFMRSRAAFERFDDAAAEREMVGPKWNVRDLAGHLAYWTEWAGRRVPELARGSTMEKLDLNKINDEVYRKNRRMSFVMLLPQLRTAEDAALAAIGRIPGGQLIEGAARECIDFALIEHYDKHWSGLKSAVERLE